MMCQAPAVERSLGTRRDTSTRCSGRRAGGTPSNSSNGACTERAPAPGRAGSRNRRAWSSVGVERHLDHRSPEPEPLEQPLRVGVRRGAPQHHLVNAARPDPLDRPVEQRRGDARVTRPLVHEDVVDEAGLLAQFLPGFWVRRRRTCTRAPRPRARPRGSARALPTVACRETRRSPPRGSRPGP